MNTEKKKPMLLLIDDNKRMIVTLSDFLSYEGFNVINAKSGEEALKKLEQITPDIIILDINMPGIGGVGFLNVLQKNNLKPDCPILVFTARSAMEDFFNTLDVAGFIAKPCSETDLLNKINEVLASVPKKENSASKDTAPIKILLGEDDMDVADQLVFSMRQSGIDFHIVKSGGEIIESAATLKPSAIVMKDILPGMNGRVVVPLLRTMPSTKNVPIILYDDTRSIEDILGKLEGLEEEEEDEEVERVSEEDGVIVQLVNKMIIDAHSRNASDIHVEPRPGKQNAVIRFRIDGACQLYQTIPYTFKRAIVSRIKIMSDLDISERRLPQDGKIKFKKYAPLDIELRVATIPTAGGVEDVVLRLLASGEPIPLEKMGMRERDYKAFIDMITKPYGIVLVVGPTGSGKTTTLHAALKYINKPEVKIWTAEDPVEITQEGLRQVQVQPKIGFDFARAMRAFLRADPDVIMVGEMRDHETVATAIEASLTGHLVFSTLHTNSAPETITRLLDMGMDPFNFADAILGILAQRLVRTLCKDCKEKYHPTQEEFDTLRREYDGDFDALGFEYNSDLVLYRAKGCAKCGNTGYRGRVAIHELLVGTDEMKSLIQNRAKMEELRRQAIKDGMITLMQDGIRKVLLGYTDLIQVRKVCIK